MTIHFTARDYREGYWYYRPDESFPPAGIFDPSAYAGEERLSITGPPSAAGVRPSALRDAWIRRLPSMHDVRILWIAERISEPMFAAVCRMSGLEAVYFKHTALVSLDGIERLKRLQSLHIGGSPRLESIEPLTRLRELRWLDLENIKRIKDISALAACRELVGLALEGSMWTTQKVSSLTPIGELRELRHLRLTNLRADDGTLAPLYGLRKLECLRLARWWDPAEVEALRRRNPAL